MGGVYTLIFKLTHYRAFGNLANCNHLNALAMRSGVLSDPERTMPQMS
jgi:hypothetical protein